jgi:hypothetical protein
MRAFDHIPASTVRFWAWLDSAVTWSLALPPLSPHFIGFLYTLNGWIGGTSVVPHFEPIHGVFVSLTGSLVSVWVLARLLHPVGLLAVIDGWARLWVGASLLWWMLGYGAPPILGLFVLTEWLGALAQLRAAYFPSGAAS